MSRTGEEPSVWRRRKRSSWDASLNLAPFRSRSFWKQQNQAGGRTSGGRGLPGGVGPVPPDLRASMEVANSGSQPGFLTSTYSFLTFTDPFKAGSSSGSGSVSLPL